MIEVLEETKAQVPKTGEIFINIKWVGGFLFPDGEIETDLVQIKDIEDKIKELQDAKKALDEITEASNDGEGEGDCKEGGFWITPKCADNCWSIDDPTWQYDYLIDIGVCDSFVVVQRSKWIQKTETDFSQVEGAYEIVSKREMSMSQLHQMLDVIKEPGYLQEPKQCFHNVRLIDLGSKSIDTWTNNFKQVNSRVSPFVLTKSNGSLYDSVRVRFNDDVCRVKTLNGTNDLLKSQDSKAVEERAANELLKPQDSKAVEERAANELSKPQDSLEQWFKVIEEIQVFSEPVITKARMDVINFNKNFINHRNCKNIRNSKISYDFEININSAGIAYNVKYLGEREVLNRSNKKLLDITEDSLYQTSYRPGLSDGKPVSSVLRQPITLSKGVCE